VCFAEHEILVYFGDDLVLFLLFVVLRVLVSKRVKPIECRELIQLCLDTKAK
jgi:hypothetical protein